MNKVYACIDGLTNSAALLDAAIWAAGRLSAPLELLHVLERQPAPAPVADLSGAIGLGAQEALLQQLSELDEQRAKLAQEVARRMLAEAATHASEAGAASVGTRMRHGDLVESLTDLEPDARLFVLGEHYHADSTSKIHLDHRLERVIRAVQRPVLVVPGPKFTAPSRFVIAFDGSPTAKKAVDKLAASPLLAGLPAQIVMVGDDAEPQRAERHRAEATLTNAGFSVTVTVRPGEPEAAIPALLRELGDAMLVMGAYGHSRIRQFIVGSTTTTLLRVCDAPVLVLR
jgi:nucleotide-binding universal stress UspA family protein